MRAPGLGVEPGQLAADLQRQLAGRRDDQRRAARGRAAGVPSAPSSCGAMARPKATVLPEPVWAETIRSRPSASASSTAAWTGVGAA